MKIFWSDQIFLVWVSSQTNIFWSGKSKFAILFKITGYDFKNSLIFCKYTLKLNCNRLKNIWRSFNFVFIDSDQIFVLVWIFARPKFFGLGQTAICPPLLEIRVQPIKKFFRNNDRFFCRIYKNFCHFFKLNARIQNLVSEIF